MCALPGQPLVILRRVQASDAERILDDVAAGTDHRRPRAAAKSKSGTTSPRTSATAQGFPEIPLWQEIPFFKRQKKIVLRNCGLINPDDIEEYIAVGGYQALYKVLIDGKPEMVIEQIKAAKLRGRGGAGYSHRPQMGVPAQSRSPTRSTSSAMPTKAIPAPT